MKRRSQVQTSWVSAVLARERTVPNVVLLNVEPIGS